MVATNRPRYFILDKIRVLSFLRIKTICNKSGSRVASNWRLTQYSTPFNTVIPAVRRHDFALYSAAIKRVSVGVHILRQNHSRQHLALCRSDASVVGVAL